MTPPSQNTIRIFGIFSALNFFFFYFSGNRFLFEHGGDNLRLIAGTLALLLAFCQYWPAPFKRFLLPIWYITICYSLPFFCAYMFLENFSSSDWRYNVIIGLFWFGLITDWITFVILLPVGILLALLYHQIMHGDIEINIYDMRQLYTHYSFAIIIAMIFSRNKELVLKSQRIEELDKLQKSLYAQSKQLEGALRAKTEFLSNISHEIRTPIHGVSNISAGLVEQWQDLDEKKKLNLAKQVADNAARLNSLIAHILDFSKYSAGKMLMDFRAINVKKIIKEVIKHIKNSEVKISFVGEKKIIIADGERLAQVLYNIVVNAMKFSSKAGKIEVLLAKSMIIQPDGSQCDALLFTVKDQGVGVPKDELENIFIPFIQSSRTKTKAGGTGLGLAICREIIEAHHGKIWAENNKDNGTSIKFLLPIEQQKLADDNHIIVQTNHGIEANRERIEKNLNILIIDDELSCLTSMELLLSKSGHKLFKANTGKEGLEIIAQQKIDIVLLDLMMPDMYGLSVLSAMKENPQSASIPVILQSGTSDEAELEKAFELGAKAYIRKPYQREAVIDIINQVRQYVKLSS